MTVEVIVFPCHLLLKVTITMYNYTFRNLSFRPVIILKDGRDWSVVLPRRTEKRNSFVEIDPN